jgi:inosine-uridine nucleoside N-ribohydrolase
MKRVILNTDIFGDPDDLYSLLFLLGSKDVKIEMIITSDECKGGRAAYTKQLLAELGIDIPVFCGKDLGNNVCYFATPKKREKISKDYVSAIKNLDKKFTFLCISSQSELAKVVDVLKEKKANVIIMGGSTQKQEHNINCDIPAARKVLKSKISTKWIPSNLTMNDKIKIDKKHELYKKIAKSKSIASKYLKQNMDAFFKKLYPYHFLHDPLEVSVLLDKKIIQFKRKTFELKKAQFIPSKKGFAIDYGVKADYNRFLRLFNKRIGKWI